jgi:hypothetical protein
VLYFKLPLLLTPSQKLTSSFSVQQNSRNASVRAYFDHQRKQSDNADITLQHAWFRGMKNVLQEVDEALRCIPLLFPLHYLDVG